MRAGRSGCGGRPRRRARPGLTADELRTGLGDPRVLGAVLDFLANHEPDLIACADALETEPGALIHAARVLNS